MKKSLLTFVVCLLIAAPSSAQLVTLSFEGTVDSDFGFTIGGTAAPVGSGFTLDVGIDASMAGTGIYSVESISYSLAALGASYNTTTDWSGIGTTLVATQSGTTIDLVSDPLFSSPDEHFLLGSLSGFGTASFDDPSTWQTNSSSISGDVIVRGVGGFASLDQLSGAAPYSGTLQLTVTAVPEPVSLPVIGMLMLGTAIRRKRN